MELIGYDTARIVYLTQVYRQPGQAYVPEMAQTLVGRYSFAKFPTLDDLQSDSFRFEIGKFQNVQINELSIYNDGVVVSARCNTEILAELLEDLFQWASQDYGIVPVPNTNQEMHYESGLVVRADCDIAAVVSPTPKVSETISSFLQKNTQNQFSPSGAIFDCEINGNAKSRKPARFLIERRFGVPFSDNTFYCQSPLPTDAHLELLQSLEGLNR